MNTQLATSQIRMQNWVSIIQDQKSSGLTINEYCREHQISRNAYFYWLRKIRRTALESSGCSFTEVPISDVWQETASPPFSPQMTIQIGKSLISVNGNTPKSLLSMVCEVLSDAQ